MNGKHISLGVIIAIILIFYWWSKDHPRTEPARVGFNTVMLDNA